MPAIEQIRTFHILLGAALLYLVFCLITLPEYPLVQAPQLDARENLELAAQLDSGATFEEPFYRAMLYPWLLSLVEPDGIRPTAGAFAGFLLHLLNGFLVYRLGQLFWKHRGCALFGAGLYLLNPASLFYSVLLLDITLGISFFLAGVYWILRGADRIPWLLLGGLSMGLACVTRPHFLPVALLLPVILVLLPEGRSWKAALPLVPLVVIFLIQGWANNMASGVFRILPWQGSYNLYAANRAESNGLYYTQVLDLSGRGSNTNPAKVESIQLYAGAHPGKEPPYSIDAMNSYWRGQFLERALTEPLELAGLWLYKAYAVVNAHEQYNNLTFSFHKARIPALRFNPLGWGILFVAGCLGLLQLCRLRPRTAGALLVVIFSYASMLILFYASGRFRLPLVPLMAVCGGGVILLIRTALQDRRTALVGGIVLFASALLAFSSFAGIRNTDTRIQDRLLLANAHAGLEEDFKAAQWARKVLQESPGRAEAQRIYAISYFNMRLEDNSRYTEFGKWKDQKDVLQLESTTDPVLASIFACYLWHWGETDKAASIWTSVAQSAQKPAESRLARLALSAINREADGTPGPEVGIMQELLETADDR